jgi:(2Fe-2S) ferredoxin
MTRRVSKEPLVTNKRKNRPAAGLFEQDQTIVVVCRGGDCGSRRKHPEVDYVGQLRRMREGLDGAALVVTSKCLDACEHSNVVVIVPGAEARETDPTPVWLGTVNDEDTTEGVVEWVSAGGPATAPTSVAVHLARFTPTRLSRHELEGDAVLLPK